MSAPGGKGTPRGPLVLSVRVDPTGDWAHAEDLAEIGLAARDLMRTAREHGAGRPRAAFYCNGQLVRSDVGRAEIGT